MEADYSLKLQDAVMIRKLYQVWNKAHGCRCSRERVEGNVKGGRICEASSPAYHEGTYFVINDVYIRSLSALLIVNPIILILKFELILFARVES